MATSEERNFGRGLNTWVQTIGILIAAAWGAYAFIYKEVLLPKSAPVNISMNLQLKKIGPGGSEKGNKEKQLFAVEMRVSATNPSPRQVYLLTSAWIAYGFDDTVSAGKRIDKEAAKSVLNSHEGYYVLRHADISGSTVIAVGNLFRDSVLKPNETLTKTVMLYVPPTRYDRIEVIARIPSMGKKRGAELDWTLGKDGLDLHMCRVISSTECREMEKDQNDAYSAPDLELEMSTTSSQLSLWQ
jgi:hypothetical protein